MNVFSLGSYSLTRAYPADSANMARPNRATLSQQTLMELFLENIEHKEFAMDETGSYKDVHDWKGLEFNQKDEITHIQWSIVDFRPPWDGTIDLQWLPTTLVKFSSNTRHVLRHHRNIKAPFYPNSAANFI